MRSALAAMVTLMALAASMPPPARADAAADVTFEPLVTDRDFITNAAWAPDGRLFFTEKDAGDVMVARDGVV